MVSEPTQPQRPSLPVPDPTQLTTDALLREISHLRELLTARIESAEDSQNAYEQAHAEAHRIRATEVAQAIEHLTELCAERFAGIQTQLVERDSRVQESSQASKDAIAAALAAQKEAVAKSEESTKEQLASIKSENATTVASLESKIENVKELIGTAGVQAGQQAGRGAGLDLAATRTFAAIGLVIALAAVIVTVIIGTR